ncbi:MAG: hypothetical protein HKO95_04545 [Rhodobacteraceae bacterium]|nr:hypothetical protein [Alphaproteobacteria bacterium]MBT8476603.1 hypothetical protein [Alphaproteobacteria bacterium]NNK65986.1 hypothetical protein [Paracoccaceae bacterium]
MQSPYEINKVDFTLIEAHARQLRAEAFGAGVKALKNWIAARIVQPVFGGRTA